MPISSPTLKIQSGGKGIRQTVTTQQGWVIITEPLELRSKLSLRIAKLKAVIGVGIARDHVLKQHEYALNCTHHISQSINQHKGST